MASDAVPVLVVDDDGDLRSLVADVLSDEGYAVTTAANGAEALTLLRTAPLPRVVLLDLVMPVVDGHAVLDAMEADAALRAVPVVILSGATGEAKHRAAAVVPKPVELDRLLDEVARQATRA